ncbi:MAG: prephenate dehydratase [Candidatus Acidiferrales bacterium]
MNDGKSRPRIAFQGERGAFSEEAALLLLGAEIELVPCPTFDALFASIGESKSDLVLAPIENSLAGSVHRTYDLLLDADLQITAEVIHRIVHNLIGMPGAKAEEIASVESHPVALAQCERFFAEYPKIKRIAAEDTAGSVRKMMEQGDRTRAAIASGRASEIYGASVLRESVEDHSENYTRFLLLAREPKPDSDANKLSISMQLAHQPGSLHRALGVFARRGINMVKIESRPIPGSPWQYRFYLDLQASLADADTRAALNELKECTDSARVLGCYPAFANAAASLNSDQGEAK